MFNYEILESRHHQSDQLIALYGILLAFYAGGYAVEFYFTGGSPLQFFLKIPFLGFGFFSPALGSCLTAKPYNIFHRIMMMAEKKQRLLPEKAEPLRSA